MYLNCIYLIWFYYFLIYDCVYITLSIQIINLLNIYYSYLIKTYKYLPITYAQTVFFYRINTLPNSVYHPSLTIQTNTHHILGQFAYPSVYPIETIKYKPPKSVGIILLYYTRFVV